jgi:hypothetical protein
MSGIGMRRRKSSAAAAHKEPSQGFMILATRKPLRRGNRPLKTMLDAFAIGYVVSHSP